MKSKFVLYNKENILISIMLFKHFNSDANVLHNSNVKQQNSLVCLC